MEGGGGGGPAKMRKILQNLGCCPAKANSQVGKSEDETLKGESQRL